MALYIAFFSGLLLISSFISDIWCYCRHIFTIFFFSLLTFILIIICYKNDLKNDILISSFYFGKHLQLLIKSCYWCQIWHCVKIINYTITVCLSFFSASPRSDLTSYFCTMYFSLWIYRQFLFSYLFYVVINIKT